VARSFKGDLAKPRYGKWFRETEAKRHIQPIDLGLSFSAGTVTISLPKNAVITVHYVCCRGNATTGS
jgi:hypothetical protein